MVVNLSQCHDTMCMLFTIKSVYRCTIISHLVPSAPPSSVSVTGVTSTALTIQWGSVPCILQNGDITGYSVRYYADGPVQTMSIFGMSLETTLPDLVSSTTYLVQVAAVNNVGTGEFSNTRSQMTLGMYLLPYLVAVCSIYSALGTGYVRFKSNPTLPSIGALLNDSLSLCPHSMIRE